MATVNESGSTFEMAGNSEEHGLRRSPTHKLGRFSGADHLGAGRLCERYRATLF
jgi:hypothetical protein